MLRTAIDVKEALDNASSKLSSIGTCEQVYLEWKAEQYGGGFDDEEDEKLDNIYKLKDALMGNYYSEFSIPDEFSIRLGEYSGTLNISQSDLKTLFDKAEDSPFGDVKNLETKIDKDVRDAKEITDIDIDPNLITRIQEEWEKSLFPSKVRVVPYKLNMYSSKGKFQEHLDTPDKDLVGTALISLWSGNVNSYLEISDVNKERNTTWRPDAPSCILFYSDCPHQVRKSWGENDNIRATLAFKIYAESGNSSFTDFQIENAQRHLKPLLTQEKVGFILEHGYSLSTNALKGTDAVLIQALEKMGHKCLIIPILHHFTLESYHQNDDHFSSSIYPLREEELDYLLGKSELQDFPHKNYHFYIMNDKFYYWRNEHQDFCEWTGNESNPENQDSIYLSRAVILL